MLDSGLDPAPRLPTTSVERRILAVSISVLLGLLAAELARGYSIVKLSVLGIALAWIPLLVLHELGHAVAGWLVGWRIREIVIGFGRELASWRLGTSRVRLRAAPVEGYVAPSPTDLRHARIKSAFIYAAGPGSELVLLAVLWLAMGERLTAPPRELWQILGQSVAVAALMGVIFNLLPYPASGGMSDGLGILVSLAASDRAFQHRLAHPFLQEAERALHAEQPEAALGYVEQGLRAYPGDPQLEGLGAVCQAALGHLEPARTTLGRLGTDQAPSVRAELLVDAALVCLCEGELAQARQAAEQAHTIAGEDVRTNLVLGRILFELGSHERAYRTLMTGYKLTRERDEEGQFVAYLALVCQALGNQDFAGRFLAAARRSTLGPGLKQRVLEEANRAAFADL